MAILPDGNVAFLRDFAPFLCIPEYCGPPCDYWPDIIFTNVSQFAVAGGVQDAPVSPVALAVLAILLITVAVVRLR